MLHPVDAFFMGQPEPERSCLQYLRNLILDIDPEMTEEWKFSMPFYYLKGKMFCYLRHHKTRKQPYIGIMEGRRLQHPLLLQEGRARVKILLVDPGRDIDTRLIRALLLEACAYYQR